MIARSRIYPYLRPHLPICCLLTTVLLSGQEMHTLVGPDDVGIPFANVYFPAQKRGTLTDVNGHFTIDLSGGAAADEITLSCLNYLSRIIAVTDFRQLNDTVRLEASDYVLATAEVSGDRVRFRPKKIGVTGGLNGARFDFQTEGTEIGTIMQPRERCRLENVNFHVDNVDQDSFRVEVNLYRLDHGQPTALLLRNRVFKTVTAADERSLVTIPLADQQIWLEGDFLVALKMIPLGGSNGGAMLEARTKSGRRLVQRGDGRWEDTYLYPAIYTTVGYPK